MLALAITLPLCLGAATGIIAEEQRARKQYAAREKVRASDQPMMWLCSEEAFYAYEPDWATMMAFHLWTLYSFA